MAPYKAFSREKLPAKIGAYVGLMHVNITLIGEYLIQSELEVNRTAGKYQYENGKKAHPNMTGPLNSHTFHNRTICHYYSISMVTICAFEYSLCSVPQIACRFIRADGHNKTKSLNK